ncbi:hypothetical protein PHYSODRAFT_259239 [Phytophthora sojae]|uniref:Uncharacterized protein n=1 Tax=Phytophthora sojae (strain P6497) TaxID=1094619 RepID=G4ZU42_PHYSP|nr:hypothetical protein PHYSODRAFT_259239 [Phytophthora sojae]EGZ13316.1 hypothetical protein PHYSODRAFT_259239 [Phytophthora sojae]|eukprot:XP_009530745.1 hypothetical protein PHYSODRAFT_259239 [Phytophthora sojae]
MRVTNQSARLAVTRRFKTVSPRRGPFSVISRYHSSPHRSPTQPNWRVSWCTPSLPSRKLPPSVPSALIPRGRGSSAPPPEGSASSLEGSAVPTSASASASVVPRATPVAAQAPGVPGASPSPTPVAAGAGGASDERQDSVEVDTARVSVDSGLSEPSMSSPRERSSPTPRKPVEGGRGVSARSEVGAPSSPPQSPSSVRSDDSVDPVSGPTRFCRLIYTEAHEPASPEPSSSAPGDAPESSPRAPIPWSLEAALEDLIDASVARTVRRSESRLEDHLDQRLADLGQLMIGLVRFPPLRVDYDLDQRLADARSLSDVFRAVSPDALPRSLGLDEEVEALRQEVRRLEEAAVRSERRLNNENDIRLRTEQLCTQASAERGQLATVAQALRDERDSISRQLATANRALAQSVEVIDHLKAQVSKRDSSLTSLHAVIKKDRQSFREGLSRYSDTLKKFHAYLQQSNDQRFILANLDLGDDSLLPPVLKEFLRDFASMDFELSVATAPLKRPPISEVGTEASVPRPLVAPSSPHPSDASTSSLPGSPDRLSNSSAVPSDRARGAEDVGNSSVLTTTHLTRLRLLFSLARMRSAPTVASLQSKVAVESENAPDDVVLGLDEPSVRRPVEVDLTREGESSDPVATRTPASSRGGSSRNPKKVSAKGAKIQLRQRSQARALPVAPVAPASRPRVEPVQPRAGPVPVRQTTVQARRAEASSRPAASTARRDQLHRRGNYDGSLLSPPFASPGAKECWREILETRTVPPVQRLPKSSVRLTGSKFSATGRILITPSGVGSTESHDLAFALYERAHWASPVAVERWLDRMCRRLGEDSEEYLAIQETWLQYSAERNARSDRLRIQIKRWWAQLLPDADGKFGYTPEVLFEPSVLHYSLETLSWLPSSADWVEAVVEADGHEPWRNCWIAVPSIHPYNTRFAPCNPGAMLFIPRGFTLQEVASAVIVSPVLEVSAPWVREYTHYHGVPAPAEELLDESSVQAATDGQEVAGNDPRPDDSPNGAPTLRSPERSDDAASPEPSLVPIPPAGSDEPVLSSGDEDNQIEGSVEESTSPPGLQRPAAGSGHLQVLAHAASASKP